ncbi:iron-sulfur cluster biosynthesis family protein [Streptococcaceae bacterium ESL0687]|nr:iron-sulfur cluster biosynthesis family protein [Streptococcaceae bacterium ESL0687]
MYLKITDEAQEKIKKMIGDKPAKLIFDMDDGNGLLSRKGSCSLFNHFRILLVDPDFTDPVYDNQMDSDLGPMPYKGYSKNYLSDKMKLSLENFRLFLTCDYESLDRNFEIIDFRNK